MLYVRVTPNVVAKHQLIRYLGHWNWTLHAALKVERGQEEAGGGGVSITYFPSIFGYDVNNSPSQQHAQPTTRPANKAPSQQLAQPTTRPANNAPSQQLDQPTTRPANHSPSQQRAQPTTRPANNAPSQQLAQPTTRPANNAPSQ